MVEDYKWYVVHTYSGYENKVADNILKAAVNRNLTDQIAEAMVPTETIYSLKAYKDKAAQRNAEIKAADNKEPYVKVIEGDGALYYLPAELKNADFNSDNVKDQMYVIREVATDLAFEAKETVTRRDLLSHYGALNSVFKLNTDVQKYVPGYFFFESSLPSAELPEELESRVFYTTKMTRWPDNYFKNKKTVRLGDIIEHGGERNTIKATTSKLMPGYVLVKLAVSYHEKTGEDRMTDEVWYIIRNTRGCTGFVGPEGVPVPLTESEIEKFGVEKHTVELNFAEGDLVTIIDGPFAGYSGVVSRIDIEDDVVCVILPIMGRDTPIDLSLDQVESAVD